MGVDKAYECPCYDCCLKRKRARERESMILDSARYGLYPWDRLPPPTGPSYWEREAIRLGCEADNLRILVDEKTRTIRCLEDRLRAQAPKLWIPPPPPRRITASDCLPKKAYQWTYDCPTGVYVCPEMAADIAQRAMKPGPTLAIFGAFRFKGRLSDLSPTSQTGRALTYQYRWLRAVCPSGYPGLRAVVPSNFGRCQTVMWYAPQYEGVVLPSALTRVPEIDTEDVL